MRITLSIILLNLSILAQDYTWPTNLGKHLSSNFGEFRPTGYHQGLDMKTKGTIGHPVYAVSNGYISRIVSNFSGFGRALYLTLEDGQTAVYGHLSKFTSKLEDRLIEQQEKDQTYITNIFLSPGEFPFDKGDIIAYSGNTGFSFGPHLHFEIRNKKGQTLNPLTSGLNQEDRLAPLIDEIAGKMDGKLKVCKIDVDKNMQTAARFGVRGIPYIVLLKDGKEVDSVTGNDPSRVSALAEQANS